MKDYLVTSCNIILFSVCIVKKVCQCERLDFRLGWGGGYGFI